jgi:hypothetical protein
MEVKKEQLRIWAQASADDLRDAEKLFCFAKKMKALGDDAGMREFVTRAKTHLEYVDEANQKLNNSNITYLGDKTNFQLIRLSILEEEQIDRADRLKESLKSL